MGFGNLRTHIDFNLPIIDSLPFVVYCQIVDFKGLLDTSVDLLLKLP